MTRIMSTSMWLASLHILTAGMKKATEAVLIESEAMSPEEINWGERDDLSCQSPCVVSDKGYDDLIKEFGGSHGKEYIDQLAYPVNGRREADSPRVKTKKERSERREKTKVKKRIKAQKRKDR